MSTEWLQQHLKDPNVRIVATGDAGRYGRGHIPGALNAPVLSNEERVLVGTMYAKVSPF